MGVKHGREYEDIIVELSEAIGQIDRIHHFFEMDEMEWAALEGTEQRECIRTLADDVFYGLGTERMLKLEGGSVSHDSVNHVLKVSDGERLVSLVRLT